MSDDSRAVSALPSGDAQALKDFRHALQEIAAGAHYTAQQLATFAESILEQHPCAHTDFHFDRSFCVCGSMHDYCDACGEQLDGCAA